MKRETLRGVCNGAHLWNLSKEGQLWDSEKAKDASFSIEELKDKVRRSGDKAIMIVDNNKQKEIVEELNKLQPGHASGLVAKRIAPWSKDADLWMVRSDVGECGQFHCGIAACDRCVPRQGKPKDPRPWPSS